MYGILGLVVCLTNEQTEQETSLCFQAKKELGLDDTDDCLKNMILARQQTRGQQVGSYLYPHISY